MRVFWSKEQVAAARLPPWQHEAVADAVAVLEEIFGPGFGPERGFVALVEETDTAATELPTTGVPLGRIVPEGAWRRHGALLGVVLWGNAGDGATVVCPERPGYAEDVQELLREQL